jgi:hypothetical protein
MHYRNALRLMTCFTALSALAVVVPQANAAVSVEEAQALGKTLTPIGAEMAGNLAGTIPAYTGETPAAPASFVPGSGIRPDPFAADQVKFSITAANLEQYAGQLTEATKELLRRYPQSYRVDVYPSRRSMTFPQSVLDSTSKNATTISSKKDGLILDGGYGGYPFPIPKNAYEVMWNHLTRYSGQGFEVKAKNLIVDASGHPSLATTAKLNVEYPYYQPSAVDSGNYYRIRVNYTAPARRAGEQLLVVEALNTLETGRRAWIYLPGQRRTKLAPDVAYDTPDPANGGSTTYDDTFVFNGAMDRYDFKLLSKQEMYIPYNNYKLVYQSNSTQLLQPEHLNPDLVRWELHRVWVVEATLKPDQRHVYERRTFYIDEDSWLAVASDSYDKRGQLFRTVFAHATSSYDVKAIYADTQSSYDFTTGMYTLGMYSAEDGGVKYIDKLPETRWSAESLASAGIR